MTRGAAAMRPCRYAQINRHLHVTASSLGPENKDIIYAHTTDACDMFYTKSTVLAARLPPKGAKERCSPKSFSSSVYIHV